MKNKNFYRSKFFRPHLWLRVECIRALDVVLSKVNFCLLLHGMLAAPHSSESFGLAYHFNFSTFQGPFLDFFDFLS